MTLDAERGIPDFTGEGEYCDVRLFFLTVSGVKLTCFTVLELADWRGVVGTDGRTLSRFGLLGLLVKEGIDDGFEIGFFMLALACRRIDLTRANLPGLRRKLFDSGFGRMLKLLVLDGFGRVRGVPIKLGFDGDLDKVGIWVEGVLVLTARASDDCVGVEMAARRFDCDRGMFGVIGLTGVSLDTGRTTEVSSWIVLLARLAGAVFSNRSDS